MVAAFIRFGLFVLLWAGKNPSIVHWVTKGGLRHWKTRDIIPRKSLGYPEMTAQIFHTVVLWLICRHKELGNSTYMKVILTKNLTFITIIYQKKFQFTKMSRTLKKTHFFLHFLVHKNHRNSKNYIFFIVLEIITKWNFVW